MEAKHFILWICHNLFGLLLWFSSKESVCNAGDVGSIPGLGRSLGEGNGSPPQYSCLGKSHGQRSLVGYSLEGVEKELDMTKQLNNNIIYLNGPLLLDAIH